MRMTTANTTTSPAQRSFNPTVKAPQTMNTQQTMLLAALALTLSAPITAQADDKHHPAAAPGSTATATVSATDLTDGEVRKIDLEAGKVTLKHANIKSLDMPGMTMVFVVKDKALLGKLKTGDKVKFKAVNDSGKFTVTEIQPAR